MAPVHLKYLEGIITGSLNDFINLSKNVGDPVKTMAEMVYETFEALQDFIKRGIYVYKPTDKDTYERCLEPLNVSISSIQELRSSHRANKYFDHLSTVSESLTALSWVIVERAPAQFIRDMKESGEYYGIRVLKNFKGNQLYSDWVNSWYAVLKDLENYVQLYFPTGFIWGAEILDTPPAGVLPPPPPPNYGSFGFIPTSDQEHEDDRAALLRDLNSGTDITKRLKKVNLQSSSGKSVKPSAHVPSYQAAQKKVHVSKFLLDGKKWCIEHQTGNTDLEVLDPQMSESVAMYRCEFCVLRVYKKINYITIDSCKKVSIILPDIISSVEVIHCDSIEIQCNGRVPLINVDGSENIQIFTNDESHAVEVISSKSSSINISALTLKGDYVEMPVPEQIRTVVNATRDKLISTLIEKN